MKTAEIVEAGKKAVAQARADYVKTNVPPPGAKDSEGNPVTKNKPPASYDRKVLNGFLGQFNLHEAFIEDILGLGEKLKG